MQLVQDGVIELDKPAYQYLSKPLADYREYKDLAGDDRWKKITPRMLLSHTSGFPNWRRFTPDQKLHINFEPGSRYAYSGEGIALLQLVVESATKKSLEDLMQEKVFKPLNMTRTSMTWHLNYEENHAEGYDENGKSLGPQRRLIADAAGSMKTTPRDFALFLQAVASGQLLARGLSELDADSASAHQIQTSVPDAGSPKSLTKTMQSNSVTVSAGDFTPAPTAKRFSRKATTTAGAIIASISANPKWAMVIMTNSSNGENIYDELLQKLQKNNFTPLEWEGFPRRNIGKVQP